MNGLSNIALSLVCLVGFELIGFAQSSTITTYAGIGHWPVSGTQAITQPIGSPVSIIPDNFGGFYFAGSDQPRIYRVAADGRVTVIAGIGTAEFSGDGAPSYLRSSRPRRMSRWMRPAICLSPTSATTASGKSTRTVSSAP